MFLRSLKAPESTRTAPARERTIFEKSTFSIQIWFWKRFGALSGSFWELLGVSWELFGASRSTKEGLQIRLGTLLGLVCSLLAAEDGLGSVDVVFLSPLGAS